MPVFNRTVDDISPLISYGPLGAWGDSPSTDPSKKSYMGQTFHQTNQSGATATFTFNGSAVYVFGAFRQSYDVYLVTLDGVTHYGNANSNGSTEFFKQLMFSATNLSDDQHQIVLQNNPTTVTSSGVDIDYILVTTGDGNATSPSVDTIMDDTDPSITYSSGWLTSPNNLSPDYFNITMHRTSQSGASAQISFQGNAIAVYGATSGNHALYTAEMDGGLAVTLNGSASHFYPQNTLYYADGLPNASHTVTMRNIDTTGKFFDLDKVVVSNWIKQPGNISEHTNQNNSSAGVPTNSAAYPSSAPVSRKSSGPLIGGVIAAVAILALVLLIISIWIYRRSRRTLRISNDTTNVELGGEDPVSTVSSQAITESFQRISDTNVLSTSGNANTSELHTHMRHPIILGALLPVRPSSSADEQRTSSTAIKSIHRSSLPALVNPASFRLDNGDDADITDDLPPPNYDEAMAPVSTTGINF